MTLVSAKSGVPSPPETITEATNELNAPSRNSASETVESFASVPDRLVLQPYPYAGIEKHPSPPTDVLHLWIEVGNGIDKNQQVVWQSAVDSLEYSFKYISSSADARHFVETYVGPIIGILVDQQPLQIGKLEQSCVEDSLTLACLLTAKDLSIQLQRGLVAECVLLNSAFSHILNKKRSYFKGNKTNWNVNHHMVGFPEVRLRCIERFRAEGGFKLLAKYLEDKVLYQQFYNTQPNLQQTAPGSVSPNLPNPSALFPKLDPIHHILQALLDSLLTHNPAVAPKRGTQVGVPTGSSTSSTIGGTVVAGDFPPPPSEKTKEDDAIMVAQAVMKYIHNTTENELKKIPTDHLSSIVQADLQKIFDRLINSRRDATYQFYSFWRSLVLKLISSQSLPLKLFGWEQLGNLIVASTDHALPPRQYLVSGAGCSFTNGLYYFAGPLTNDGYAKNGGEVLYTRTIPLAEAATSDTSRGGAAGKKLTLFRCTMRSNEKWWYLSEADEQLPGTDRDIDYYQHRSKKHEEAQPQRTGWLTCRAAGLNPPPTLEPQGLMAPPGKEYDTLEHQLAKWAIENEIVEGVLGDSTIHREIVARSTVLIKFLAAMCNKYDEFIPVSIPTPSTRLEHDSPQQSPGDDMTTDESTMSVSTSTSDPTRYCLQISHLLFAWKTCTRKADAAVSAQLYQLLVQILPSCPSELAIPLLNAIQTTLHESSAGADQDDCLHEVAEFCTALASTNLIDHNSNSKNSARSNGGGNSANTVSIMKDDVRKAVLNLLWSVLIYPGASTLKSYESLKRYVKTELKVEPSGNEHRERFLISCIQYLSAIVENDPKGSIDESQVLRILTLTRFILESCPREQADRLVSEGGGKLPLLLFSELKSYMNRRKSSGISKNLGLNTIRRIPTSSTSSISIHSLSTPTVNTNTQHSIAFDERLRILRYVYGLSDPQSTALSGTSGSVGAETMPTPSNAEKVTLTLPMLENLWALCDTTDDQEAFMLFIASASDDAKPDNYDITGPTSKPAKQQGENGPVGERLLSAAFNEEVCFSAFLNLFCSLSFNYENMGEIGYRSFQFIFKKLRSSAFSSSQSKKVALDALWRVCLTTGKSSVALQAMQDLLFVYVSVQQLHQSNGKAAENGDESMSTDEQFDESFGDRIFQCLEKVKHDLDAQLPSAELSAERCMRILNAAIGQQGDYSTTDGLATSATLHRLSKLQSNYFLDDALKCLPHGMRGQSSYRRVGIIANRQQAQNQQGYETSNSTRLPSTVKFSLDVHPIETLSSLKIKVAKYCQCMTTAVKPIKINGRARSNSSNDLSHLNLNVVPDDSVMDELGILQGCEIVFVISDRAMQNTNNNPHGPQQGKMAIATARNSYSTNDLSTYFFSDASFVDRLFSMVLLIVESLPWRCEDDNNMSESDADKNNSTAIEYPSSMAYKLAWDLLLAMPTNISIASRVKSAQSITNGETNPIASDDAMEVEVAVGRSVGESWSPLLDSYSFERSVYVLLTIDALLQPAPETFSTITPEEFRRALETQLLDDAVRFRKVFIEAGGFSSVVHFLSQSRTGKGRNCLNKARRGNAEILRILKACLFGCTTVDATNASVGINTDVSTFTMNPDETGSHLLQSLSDTDGLLNSLMSMVVDDKGILSSTILDVLRFLQLLLRSQQTASSFVKLHNSKKVFVILLMWDDEKGTQMRTAMNVRRAVRDLILQTPMLAVHSISWLTDAMENVDVTMENTAEYFDVLEKLVSSNSTVPSTEILTKLCTAVCHKLSACPRPGSETDQIEISTGVLSGCLKLLRALIEYGGNSINLRNGVNILLRTSGTEKWSDVMLQRVFAHSPEVDKTKSDHDLALIDLMGIILDGFLAPGSIVSSSPSSSVAICFDKESRRRGFEVVSSAARHCTGDEGYKVLVYRIRMLIEEASPRIKYRWGQLSCNNTSENSSSHSRGNAMSKYSGLKNQGCTCYMNSLLQQLFMMPELRDSMCSAPLPSSLRSVGSGISCKPDELVGKQISFQWECGVSYDAHVTSYNPETGMHTINYLPIQIATAVGSQQDHIQPGEIERLPKSLPDEFFLSEGRPGKETGIYDVLVDTPDGSALVDASNSTKDDAIKETEDEASSRRLLEEVQRTFIHLKVGSKGRCFDPRALVEACTCLNLEFDVWQQNDASEFATKLLDRLETSLKKWAPSHFRYMDHTFGLEQSRQKVCRKCGLKTTKQEKLLNIDCQIKGKSDIHEALSAMTEVEIMEGANRVYCEHCKENTDTILKNAITKLPNMLILSLKRFDLDYTIFETVKVNSRYAFGQTLNMKQYTLEGLEEIELAAAKEKDGNDPKPMEMDSTAEVHADDYQEASSDEQYEYKLAGVLVHAGVAQGGHYYSFIKDRNPASGDKWFRFDDEEVTPFDPASIEAECFGGKVKKETKWPNGQVHTVEQEQFANALMLFYEKVIPNEVPLDDEIDSSHHADGNSTNLSNHSSQTKITATGYDVFEADVVSSNAAHQRQSFLFDAEFQFFLKGLFLLCRAYLLNERDPTYSGPRTSGWHGPLVDLLSTFVFDILMYSSDCSHFGEWSRMMEEILLHDMESSISFIQRLAKKTTEVSSNWLRLYLLECPDSLIRSSAAHIFSAAVRACALTNSEIEDLMEWSDAWKEQLSELNKSKEYKVIPCGLVGKWSRFEDIGNGGTSVSSLGIILSHLNLLLEAMPRCWRFSSELCLFIRYLSTIPNKNGDYFLRRPMIEAQIPARLIALFGRERLPAVFREAFPGSSISQDVANTQVRAESNPVPHVMPMNGNQGMNSDLSNLRGPTAADLSLLLEAIGCCAGLPGVIHASLVRDSEDVIRGRQRYLLSENSVRALTTVFHEVCSAGNAGMGQRDIERYLHKCGVDTGSVSTQKILDMLSKYPTTGGTDQNGGSLLSLDGFLAYYRDFVQSNDTRLRLDLHTFGFRLDLSRRSHDSRFFRLGERETQRSPAESVACDVAEVLKEKTVDLGTLANFALTSTVHFYVFAHQISEPLMEYLVAGMIYRKEVETLINRTLIAIYSTPTDWGGSEEFTGLTALLQVIASIPGDDQLTRIGKMMFTSEKAARNVDFGAGLLQVLRGLYRLRQTHNFNHDVNFTYGRYLHILKELRIVYPVYKWMNENPNQWNFVERELLESRLPSTNHGLSRSEFARDVDETIPLDHNTHSDSDMGGMNDSEDDEESHYGNPDNIEVGTNVCMDVNDSPKAIVVSDAGTAEVNGTYTRVGVFENACKYVRDGVWEERSNKFYIFSCNVSNHTKHWYISVVPANLLPGTRHDIDFYTAPWTPESSFVAPTIGWVKAQDGNDPPPKIRFISDDDDGDDTEELEEDPSEPLNLPQPDDEKR